MKKRRGEGRGGEGRKKEAREGKEARKERDKARQQAKSHQSKSIILQSKPVLWGQVPQGWQKWREELR